MPNKALSVASVIEKNRLESNIAFLVLVQIEIFDPATYSYPEIVRAVNNDEDITFAGESWTAQPFDIELKYEAGSVPDVTLSVKDFNRVLLGKLETYAGGIGSRVTMIILNSGNLSQGPEVQEVFEIIGSSANDYVVSLKLGAESTLTRLFPGRMQMRDRCSWRYKGPECGYTAGMPTCDLSLQGPNGCAAHSNAVNFGGFPGLVNRGLRS
jgi:phage-related protein